MRVRWQTTVELAEPVENNTTNLSVAAFIPYDPVAGPATKYYAMMCKMVYTDGLITPAFKVYDH